MFFINTSQDIFYLVLSFCILWFTIFLLWMMYYAIAAIKQTYQIVNGFKQRLETLDELIRLMKEKITGASSYITVIASGVGKLIGILSGIKETSKKKTDKKS
ncbi:MAG: hypothetical protein QY321_03670 [Patescibacteria group bacterium]|nr:MAG: hypothetical protein QY321_03670 [Patescibacteria group bacterium]